MAIYSQDQYHASTQSLLQAPAVVTLFNFVTSKALLVELYCTLLLGKALPFSDTPATLCCTPSTVTLANALVSWYVPVVDAYRALFEATN